MMDIDVEKTGFERHLDYDARLVILRLLDQAGPTLNDSVLHKGLTDFGHVRLTRGDVRGHILFLAQAAALTYVVTGPTYVATITEPGRKAARGTMIIQGVARPGQE